MAIKVEHELHERRRSRNTGVGLTLVALVGVVLALTVVKVMNLEDLADFERFDHVARPQLDRLADDAETSRPIAETEAQQ